MLSTQLVGELSVSRNLSWEKRTEPKFFRHFSLAAMGGSPAQLLYASASALILSARGGVSEQKRILLNE